MYTLQFRDLKTLIIAKVLRSLRDKSIKNIKQKNRVTKDPIEKYLSYISFA